MLLKTPGVNLERSMGANAMGESRKSLGKLILKAYMLFDCSPNQIFIKSWIFATKIMDCVGERGEKTHASIRIFVFVGSDSVYERLFPNACSGITPLIDTDSLIRSSPSPMYGLIFISCMSLYAYNGLL